MAPIITGIIVHFRFHIRCSCIPYYYYYYYYWTIRESNPGGARFSASVQTGSGANPVRVKRVEVLFSWGKAAGAWRCPPTTSSAEVEERV
jgi:hypothetical protein